MIAKWCESRAETRINTLEGLSEDPFRQTFPLSLGIASKVCDLPSIILYGNLCLPRRISPVSIINSPFVRLQNLSAHDSKGGVTDPAPLMEFAAMRLQKLRDCSRTRVGKILSLPQFSLST